MAEAGRKALSLLHDERARFALSNAQQAYGEAHHTVDVMARAYESLYETLKIEPRFERTQGRFVHPGKAAALEAGWVGELRPDLLEGPWGAFELDLTTTKAAEAKALAAEVADKLLANPVIESYRVEID